jgi:hypothetical protein
MMLFPSFQVVRAQLEFENVVQDLFTIFFATFYLDPMNLGAN